MARVQFPSTPVLRLTRAMRLSRRLLLVLTVAGAMHIGFPRAALAQAEPPAATRKVDDIMKELNETGQAMSEVAPGLEVLMDEAKRAEIAPKALPVMRKMTRLLEEFSAAEPRARDEAQRRASSELRAMMAMLGDKEASDQIQKLTESKDLTEATSAKSWAAVVQWIAVRKDAAAQEKVLTDLKSLVKSQPANATIAQVASMMVDSAATPALAEAVEQIVVKDLTSPIAKQIGQSIVSKRKLNALENQPLAIEGLKVDGTKFTTADWKGKVVLVDFWATWCPPCVAELPKLKKFYAVHHDKGLEVIGVSNDRDVDDLKAYLSQNKDMPWPQLFEPGKPGWHPLTEKFGIEGIPTMFVIDRKGIVRTVRGREMYEELIPKLLAEPATDK